MIIRIDKMSEDPLYLQIRSQIIGAIARGELRPGDSLPSVRSLAADLGINLHTVNKAYAVLRDEGYLIMRGRSGAFVAEPMQNSSKAKIARMQEHLTQGLRDLIQEHKAAGGTAQEFMDAVQQQIENVYEDPGVVGPKRTIKVLGVDSQGNSLKEKDESGVLGTLDTARSFGMNSVRNVVFDSGESGKGGAR